MSATDEAVEPQFLDRELSWLDFNLRVLRLAADTDVPLLERVRFLATHASNLDEFFQVRVPGLHDAVKTGVTRPSVAGYTPREQLKAVRLAAAEQLRDATALFETTLRPALRAEGIVIVDHADLDGHARDWAVEQFREYVFPVLTPLAVDPAHPFPYISDLSLNLAVLVRRLDQPAGAAARPAAAPAASSGSRTGAAAMQHSFTRVKVPPILPRFMALPDETRFVPLESVIAAHIGDVFPGVEVISHAMFRVTRDLDIEIDDTDTQDLMKLLKYELSRRRFGEAVRLEVDDDIDEESLGMLTRELGLSPDDVVTTGGLLGLSDLVGLYDVDRPDLKFEPHLPRLPADFDAGEAAGELLRRAESVRDDKHSAPLDLFSIVRRHDVLLHFPYESFTESVVAFVDTAAHDPDVLAVKMTIYRTSERTQLVDSLVAAAELGKQVVVVVEIKARFDEEANIEWARRLERAGVHVAYGLVGLKTHSKMTLVVRREGGKIRRYTHLGTGNYNADTARYFEDFGLITCDEDIAVDASQLFNTLTGYSRHTDYRRMLVAPHSLDTGLRRLIADEVGHPDGHIVMKMNALVDTDFVKALYEASQSGCRVDLIVRGICCLVPGVAGLSENIRVHSVVGRFLEHSRVYRFGSAERGHTFLIGSADVMPRSLRHRVEALVPIIEQRAADRLTRIIDCYLADDIDRWTLDADGQWSHVAGADLHERLIELHAG